MSRWEELKKRGGEASDYLREMRDKTNRNGPEWARLNGKMQGVDLMLSYMDEIERMARI